MIYNNLLLKFKTNEEGKIVFDFDVETINAIASHIIRIIFIAILMYICIKFGNKLINKFIEKQGKSKLMLSLNEQRAVTLGSVLKSTLRYLVYFIGIAIMLTGFDSGISVGLASITGVAVGLGTQSLVKDVINGFFILFENQYGVGDHITIGTFSGIVESIGVRTTIIRDFSGDLHLLPNGTITAVTNHSRGDIRFVVKVEIAYEENIDEAIELIKNVNSKFQEKYSEELRGAVEVLGVESLNASGITITVIGRAKPLSQWKMERELRKEIKIALDAAGIEIPYPKTNIITTKNNK